GQRASASEKSSTLGSVHRAAPGRKSSSGTPKEFRAHDTRLYWPTVKTASMSCSVEYFFDSAAQVVSETTEFSWRWSATCSSARSCSLQPLALGPSFRFAMSASVRPPRLAMSSCWATSYSAWFSQPMRRIRSSRRRNGRGCLLRTWPANGVQRFTSAGWWASTLKMLKTWPFMTFFSTVVRSSAVMVERSRMGMRCLRLITVVPPRIQDRQSSALRRRGDSSPSASRLQLDHHLDLDRHAAAQGRHADRCARATARLAEDLDHEIGEAVDHLGLLGEVGRRIDHAQRLDDAAHAIERAGELANARQHAEAGEARGAIALRDIEIGAELAQHVAAVGT